MTLENKRSPQNQSEIAINPSTIKQIADLVSIANQQISEIAIIAEASKRQHILRSLEEIMEEMDY